MITNKTLYGLRWPVGIWCGTRNGEWLKFHCRPVAWIQLCNICFPLLHLNLPPHPFLPPQQNHWTILGHYTISYNSPEYCVILNHSSRTLYDASVIIVLPSSSIFSSSCPFSPPPPPLPTLHQCIEPDNGPSEMNHCNLKWNAGWWMV